jgi:geranylgeranyl diphosphate synthase type II
MHTLDDLQKQVKGMFGSYRVPSVPPELYDPITYTLKLGGKRIRPLLVLLGCDLFEGTLSRAVPVAIAVELFHNFTLLHDDIMDQAPLRRGHETVHKKWNRDVAILSGDTLFALAYESLSGTDPEILPAILGLFTGTARQVCEGQQYDMNFESQEQVSIDEYLSMIRLKTAVLLACSVAAGALVAKAPRDEVTRIYSFGENLGMAFQLRDDLLDCIGNEETFGKEIGGDIAANKKTFLYLSALQRAGNREKKLLRSLFAGTKIPPEEKIKKVREIYAALNIRGITEKKIREYFARAMNFLSETGVPAERKKNLKELAEGMTLREF